MSSTIDTTALEADTLLTEKQLASRWSTHPGTLANARCEGKGIAYVRLVSGTIRYRLSDVLASEVTIIPQNKAIAVATSLPVSVEAGGSEQAPTADGRWRN